MEHQKARGLLERAGLLLELEQQMRGARRGTAAYFPPFVHVIVHVEDEEGDTGWAGRMHAMKAILEKLAREQQAEHRQRREEAQTIKDELAALRSNVNGLHGSGSQIKP